MSTVITKTESGNSERKNATWIYETNDEGKARWRCSNCGKISHKHPHDKLYCSRCGSRMKMEA